MTGLALRARAAPEAQAEIASVGQFRARVLAASDANAFRTIRLNSLRRETVYLAVPYVKEVLLPPEEWERRCTETPDNCAFGLFHRDKLVGIVSAHRWNEDPSGKTALWKSAYVEPEYRGIGLAADLYREREAWTSRHFDRAVFFIRDGNARSTGIHLKQGARYLFTRQMHWGDDHLAPWHCYEKGLSPPAFLAQPIAAPPPLVLSCA